MPAFHARGLRIPPQVWRSMIPTLRFEPSIAITAGGVEKFGLDIRSWREPLKRSVQQVIAPSVQRNFDVGGRPPWPGLATWTQHLRQAQGYRPDAPILVRTGALRRVAGQLNIWSFTRTSAGVLELPQKTWYGALQQAGYAGNRAHIPPRPFLAIQVPEDSEAIEEVFVAWLAERWEDAVARGRITP